MVVPLPVADAITMTGEILGRVDADSVVGDD
jgi:hypothetical protein